MVELNAALCLSELNSFPKGGRIYNQSYQSDAVSKRHDATAPSCPLCKIWGTGVAEIKNT